MSSENLCTSSRAGGSRPASIPGLLLSLACGLVLACGRGEEAAPEPERASAPAPRAVVLVVVDTWRADHVGAYGYESMTSPYLDARVASGHLFEAAWATSPWTLPSFGSIFTGELPTRHGAGAGAGLVQGERTFTRLAEDVPTLAERFSQGGYATGAVANNPFLAKRFGVARGFDTYKYRSGNQREIRRADEVVDEALEWVGEQTGPFFLFVHFFDPHMDYDAPEPARGQFTAGIDSNFSLPVTDRPGIRAGDYVKDEDDLRFLAGAYDEELAFVDQELERLLASLDAQGLLGDALVLLTSDHGEELFDHGDFEHGHAMWEELLHVPFVVWGPGVRPGRSAEPVSLVDIAPTLLDAAGLEPLEGVTGQSLWPRLVEGAALDPQRPVIAERPLYGQGQVAIRVGDQKLVVEQEGPMRLYDLALDPGEGHDLAEQESDAVVSLSTRLRHLLAALDGRGTAQTVPIDEETAEDLRSLGYTE